MVTDIAWLIPLFPAAGALINGLFCRRIGRRAHWIAVSAIALSFLVSVAVFRDLLSHPEGWETSLYSWISVGSFAVDLGFRFDSLSSVMALVVSGVGLLIHLYSVGYMHEDKGYARFFCYLNLFVFFMLTLVLANNYLLLFLGWEGVGLCSYLLIGFWFHKKSASDAAKKAFIVNRIGDAGFLLGLLLLFVTFGTFHFGTIDHPVTEAPSNPIATAIALLLFVGAVGKSAQIPLYVWLPDAMEGPIPVSALIHAATMVTAGIYMVCRSHFLYRLSPAALQVLGTVGAATAFFAATIALVQNDIKKVLAYSTISQLGFMVLALGVGAFGAGMFHLVTHAFFKGLLFLGAGSVIHALGGEQDMQKMGGLKDKLPITWLLMLSGTVAIAGVPPFAGFWSKDDILGQVFKSGHYVLYLLGLSAALMTSFYMFRLLYLTFLGKSRAGHGHGSHPPHESPKIMTVPMGVLAVLSLVGGFILGFPPEQGLFHRFLEPVFMGDGPAVIHLFGISDLGLMILSTGMAITGWILAHLFYSTRPELPKRLPQRFTPLYQLLSHKYWVDELYDRTVVAFCRKLSWFSSLFDLWVIDGVVNEVAFLVRWLARLKGQFDLSVVDGFFNGLGDGIQVSAKGLRRLQTGKVQHYLLAIAVGLFTLSTLYLFFR